MRLYHAVAASLHNPTCFLQNVNCGVGNQGQDDQHGYIFSTHRAFDVLKCHNEPIEYFLLVYSSAQFM